MCQTGVRFCTDYDILRKIYSIKRIEFFFLNIICIFLTCLMTPRINSVKNVITFNIFKVIRKYRV